MTESPEITAKILNDTLLSKDLMLLGKDDLFSLQEFALGLPLANREIDLCYGYAKVPVPTPVLLNITPLVDEAKALAQFEALFGAGLTRITDTPDVIAKLTKVKNTITGLNLTNLLPASKKYKDVYVFGNIFLSQGTPTQQNDNPTATLTAQLLKGQTSGTPIFMTKDIEVESLINMSRRDEIPEAEGTVNPYIKIFNFIIEINYYDPNDISSKDVIFHFIDKRKPRGWGGFAEEFMGVYLTTSIINKNQEYNDFYQSFDENFYNLVNAWINLRYWSPSFIDFWTNPANSSLMPERLKTYLESKFSIII